LINAAEDLGTRQLNKNHAEFLAPFFSPQYLVPEQILGKCELRDEIESFTVKMLNLHFINIHFRKIPIPFHTDFSADVLQTSRF